jgi:hypothetical protein
LILEGIEYLRQSNSLRDIGKDEYLFAETIMNIGNGFDDLGNLGGDVSYIIKAVSAYRAALSIDNIAERHPQLFAQISENLGMCMTRDGVRTKDCAILDSAVAHLTAATWAFDLEMNPADWARSHMHLSDGQMKLGVFCGNVGALGLARKSIRKALRVFTKEAAPVQWANCQLSLVSIAMAEAIEQSNVKHCDDAELHLSDAIDLLQTHDSAELLEECEVARRKLAKLRILLTT